MRYPIVENNIVILNKTISFPNTHKSITPNTKCDKCNNKLYKYSIPKSNGLESEYRNNKVYTCIYDIISKCNSCNIKLFVRYCNKCDLVTHHNICNMCNKPIIDIVKKAVVSYIHCDY
jgi:hypothetical protein